MTLITKVMMMMMGIKIIIFFSFFFKVERKQDGPKRPILQPDL